MWRRVGLVKVDVSEKHIDSILRVERFFPARPILRQIPEDGIANDIWRLLCESPSEDAWRSAWQGGPQENAGLPLTVTFSWWQFECPWRSALHATAHFDKWRQHGACVQWLKKEHSADIRENSSISWKLSHCSSQRFDFTLLCQPLLPQILISELKQTRLILAVDLITQCDQGVDL
jgi:hypothetical protein